MDLSDQPHDLRVTASSDTVSLYIDGSAIPAISIAKTSFPGSTGASSVFMVSTSTAATADFDVASYRFARFDQGISLNACPPVISSGHLLTFEAQGGLPGSLNGLFVSSVDGNPFFLSIFFGTFAADCTWDLPVTVASSPAGLEVGLVLFGFDKLTGSLSLSHETFVAFQ